MAPMGGDQSTRRWSLLVRLLVGALVIAACCAAVIVLGGFLYVRVVVGVLLGIAFASEVVLPRVRNGWSRTADDFWKTVEHEIVRSRRHQRPLLLVRWSTGDSIELPDGTTQDEADGIESIRKALRGYDAMCRIGQYEYLMLSEVGTQGALPVLARIGVPIERGDVSIAQFPDDALTVEGLQAALTPLRPIPQ